VSPSAPPFLQLLPGESLASIAFTYLAPILQEITGFAPSTVGLVLLVYGISVAIGNIWGGKLADRKGPVGALKIIFLALTAVLVLLTFTASSPWLALITVLLWGAVAFGNVPGLQIYVVRQAELHTPRAIDVASGLNISPFNLGIAGGAWGGGLIVENFGLIHTACIGGLVVSVAYALTVFSGHLDKMHPLSTAPISVSAH
jgi:predicted MFS family arabinose efflux permease